MTINQKEPVSRAHPKTIRHSGKRSASRIRMGCWTSQHDGLEIESNSVTQTKKIAANLAQKVKGKAVICLYGNLGSGKTTFVQGFAKALGVSNNISSPSFILVRQYPLSDERILFHIDLYRLEGQNDIKTIGLQEILEDKNSLVLIEWAEKAKNLLPEKRIDIFFEYLDNTTRKIRVRSMYGK